MFISRSAYLHAFLISTGGEVHSLWEWSILSMQLGGDYSKHICLIFFTASPERCVVIIKKGKNVEPYFVSDMLLTRITILIFMMTILV